MARPFYPHEADDPDLDWLVSNFLYERPDYVPVDTGVLPLVLLPYREPNERQERPPVTAVEPEADPIAKPVAPATTIKES